MGIDAIARPRAAVLTFARYAETIQDSDPQTTADRADPSDPAHPRSPLFTRRS
jgi:hypothetical protein